MIQPFPQFMEFSEAELYFMGFILVLIVLDVVVGLVQAAKNGDYQSAKMREGLFHKIGTILTVALAVLMQGFCSHIGDTGWDVPLVYGVCLYVAVMEVGSILENLALINPELANTKVFDMFKNTRSEVGDGKED